MKKLSQEEAQAYLASMFVRMRKDNLRLGQAILNNFGKLGPCPQAYYSNDEAAVTSWFYANFVGEGEIETPLDLAALEK